METNNKKKEFVVEGYIIKDNSILLMHHKKLDLWLPPGGHIEENETPEEALIREIKEETGLTAEIVRQVRLDKKFNVKVLSQPTHIQLEDIKGTHYHIDFIYLCRVGAGNLNANKESKNLRFFTAEEIEKLENVPEEVKYFSKKFLNEESDKNYLKLPVMKEIVSRNSIDLSHIKLLVIQHIKKNTAEFIRILKKSGFKEIIIIGKPYSADVEALKEIEKYAKVIIPSFDELESLKAVEETFKKFVDKEDKFICLDLGGYFSKYFQNLNYSCKNLLGVIEDTKNGIWFKENEIKLKFPIFSVASSELKDYAENYFVAKAVVRNLENIMINSDFNQSLNSKKILILGYGTIGRNIAKLLRNETIVTVYDKSSAHLLKARIDGFKIIEDLNSLFDFDVIIGITGDIVLKKEHLLNLKNGVILANASTRKKEFETESIKDFVAEKKEYYTKYKFRNGKTLYIIAHGFPVNFLGTESVPEFILDIIFSEMFMLIKYLIKGAEPGFYPVEKFHKDIEDEISRIWLKYWK